MSNKAERRSPSLPSEAVILDLPLLDEYFLDWVVDRIRRILQRFGSSSDIITNVLLKFLRPIAHCVILMTTRGQTPATRLLGLQRVPVAMTTTNNNMQPKSKSSSSSSSSSFTRRDYYFRLVAYTLFSTLVPVLYAELKEWYRQRLRERLAAADATRFENGTSHNHNDTTTRQDGVTQVAAERKFQSAQTLIQVVSQIWPALRLVALLGVWSGVSQTSEVAMLLTGWTCQKQQQQNEEEPRLHVDYAQRRWLWEELIRTMRVWGQGLTLLSVWRNDVQQWKDNLLALIMARKNRLLMENAQGRQGNNSSSTTRLSMCCFCQAKPIIIPVNLHPCGHAACYACLHERSKGAVRCRLCKLRVINATSWTTT